MQILSNGFKLPQTGDYGDVWFPALEDDIQQMNDHTHNGTNSEKISLIDIDSSASVSTVLVGSFIDQGNGYWRALVNVLGGGNYDNYVVTIKDPTTKEVLYVKQEKFSTTSFYVYMNIPQTVEVFFGA